MLNVKVLGAGCANCRRLEQTVRRVAEAEGIAIELEHVTDYSDIMKWNVLATPGLVLNDRLVAAGRVLKDDEVARLLAQA